MIPRGDTQQKAPCSGVSPYCEAAPQGGAYEAAFRGGRRATAFASTFILGTAGRPQFLWAFL